MTRGSLNKRLTLVQARQSSGDSKEEAKALEVILEYLDALAARKVLGDPSAQREITAANKFIRSN